MILLIDHYDSFVYNLARYFQRLGQTTRVVRSDAITLAQIRSLNPGAIVLSPGPCSPAEAGNSIEMVRHCWQDFPMLGVCLGHQIIYSALGGEVVRSPLPMHGRTSEIFHDGRGIFLDAPNPMVACRYHSLVVDEIKLPDGLEISARTADGVVMAFRHRNQPIVGVQFHPESILTDLGFELLQRFLQIAGIENIGELPSTGEHVLPQKPSDSELPTTPVTF